MRSVFAASGLALAALVAYHDTFAVPFLFDDEPAIVENASIRRLGHLSEVLWPSLEGGVTTAGRPLVNLSFAVNVAVSGTDVWSYHALNLLVHVLSGLTLFGIVRRTLLTRQPHGRVDETDARLLALGVAALWLLHPIQTVAVTYIVQRAESMSGLLCLVTLYAFIRSSTAARPGRWLTCSVAACMLAMASKEVAVVLPIVILLYDRSFVGGSAIEAWRVRRRYYLSLAATWVVLGILVWSTSGRGGTARGSNRASPRGATC